MVVPGEQSDQGDREGVWCYFNADGSIMLTETNEYGVLDRTGYYEHGKRVRELSRSELDSSIRQAEALMREYRSKSGK